MRIRTVAPDFRSSCAVERAARPPPRITTSGWASAAFGGLEMVHFCGRGRKETVGGRKGVDERGLGGMKARILEAVGTIISVEMAGGVGDQEWELMNGEWI